MLRLLRALISTDTVGRQRRRRKFVWVATMQGGEMSPVRFAYGNPPHITYKPKPWAQRLLSPRRRRMWTLPPADLPEAALTRFSTLQRLALGLRIEPPNAITLSLGADLFANPVCAHVECAPD